jgi:hypothetical protein
MEYVVMEQELDYSPVLDALSIADQDFTEEHGAYSHEDDHSFSPKLITCSHPC